MSARSLQYYVISRKWGSDLEFYKIETAFFRHIIEDYFISIAASGYVEEMKAINKELLLLDAEISTADKMLTSQLKQIELMAEDRIDEDPEALAVIQVQLEYLINTITRQFRETKKTLFQLVERIVKDKKILLASW